MDKCHHKDLNPIWFGFGSFYSLSIVSTLQLEKIVLTKIESIFVKVHTAPCKLS